MPSNGPSLLTFLFPERSFTYRSDDTALTVGGDFALSVHNTANRGHQSEHIPNLSRALLCPQERAPGNYPHPGKAHLAHSPSPITLTMAPCRRSPRDDGVPDEAHPRSLRRLTIPPGKAHLDAAQPAPALGLRPLNLYSRYFQGCLNQITLNRRNRTHMRPRIAQKTGSARIEST